MYVTAFHIFFLSKKASAAVLADPFNSLSVSDLYSVHSLHDIFTTYLVQSSSIIFLPSTLFFAYFNVTLLM